MNTREAFEAWAKSEMPAMTVTVRAFAWAAFKAATAAERNRMEKHCAEIQLEAYNRWRADGNSYDDGQCDAANALLDKVRSGE